MFPAVKGGTDHHQQQPNGQGLDKQPLAEHGQDEQEPDEQGPDEQQLDTQVPVQKGQVQQGQDKEGKGEKDQLIQGQAEQDHYDHQHDGRLHDDQGGKDVKHVTTNPAPAEDAEVRRARIKELFGELVDLLVR